MVSDPPKISFIPKSPLVHQESFMERRRPRSVAGFLAIFLFIVSVGSYSGLYFYTSALSQEVVKKVEGIAVMQREFIQSPEIAEAKVFRARAELARELLTQHIAVSPLFAFLSSNTLGSILYDSFSFKRDKEMWVLTLKGEAPSYTSLAYQADVLRKKNAENKFVDFSIDSIALTKYGTVTFELSVYFTQNQLSYVKEYLAQEKTLPLSEAATTTLPSMTNPPLQVGDTMSVPQ
ncbi:MAG: hypothetical protein ACYCZ7_02150, partial [Minisyncoccota bacterium]